MQVGYIKPDIVVIDILLRFKSFADSNYELQFVCEFKFPK